MARTGVDFDDVAAAAVRLVESGRVVTVDNVRAELGKGSKSTLAPLVKRWKMDQSRSVEQSLSTLPADLVSAVRRLYDDLQQQFEQNLQTAQAAAEARTVELAAVNAVHVRALEALNVESAQLANELVAAGAEISSIKEQHNTAVTEVTEIRVRYESLAKNYEASNAENGHLREQIEHGRRQLEHFQNAAQLRWDAERTKGEEKLARARLRYDELRASLEQDRQQFMVAHGRLEQLVPEHERLIQEVEAVRGENTKLRLDVSRLQFELNQRELVCEELTERDATRARILADAEAQLAAYRSREEVLSRQVTTSDEQLQRTHAEIAKISGLYAEAKADLRHCREQLRDKDLPSNRKLRP